MKWSREGGMLSKEITILSYKGNGSNKKQIHASNKEGPFNMKIVSTNNNDCWNLECTMSISAWSPTQVFKQLKFRNKDITALKQEIR